MENNNLLIIGAGQYGHVAKEIAESMGTFEKIEIKIAFLLAYIALFS